MQNIFFADLLYHYIGITFDIEPASLTFIINHLFLPPKLPQRAESEVGDHNTALLDLCVHVAEAYLEQIESWIGPSVDESWELQDMWGPVVKMLKNFQSLENHNSLDAEAFKKKVRGMKPDGKLNLKKKNSSKFMYPARAFDVHRNLKC